ncbi:MAG: hypothetical protein Q9197_006803 [Variospora fuerteventurae]
MTVTPAATLQLKNLLAQPDPKMIRVGVRNRGCSGLAYHLEYVDKPGMFDEPVEQDGVKVLIDSKALFSIIGSEMDWVEDKLNQRFVFRNPNISKLWNNAVVANHSWSETSKKPIAVTEAPEHRPLGTVHKIPARYQRPVYGILHFRAFVHFLHKALSASKA